MNTPVADDFAFIRERMKQLEAEKAEKPKQPELPPIMVSWSPYDDKFWDSLIEAGIVSIA